MMLDLFDDIYKNHTGGNRYVEANEEGESEQELASKSPISGTHCSLHENMETDESTLLPSNYQAIHTNDVVRQCEHLTASHV